MRVVRCFRIIIIIMIIILIIIVMLLMLVMVMVMVMINIERNKFLVIGLYQWISLHSIYSYCSFCTLVVQTDITNHFVIIVFFFYCYLVLFISIYLPLPINCYFAKKNFSITITKQKTNTIWIGLNWKIPIKKKFSPSMGFSRSNFYCLKKNPL